MAIPQYLINSESRTFIRQFNNSFNRYDYYTCTVADTLSQSMGEVANEYYTDFKAGINFVESSTIIAPKERPSISIAGRIPRKYNSQLYQIATNKALSNMQLHFGRCYNPTIFNDFDEAIILENVSITNYTTDKLGSMSRDENAIINESVDLSVGYWYSIYKLAYFNIGSKIINDGFLPLSMDILECEECSNYDNQYCTLFVLTYNNLNPLSTPMRIYISDNDGRTWRYYELPLEIYLPTMISARYTSLTVFTDYTYIHFQTDTGLDSASKIFRIPTFDLLSSNGIWSLVANHGANNNIPSSDKIIKFKHNYYAPYVESVTYLYAAVSRIVNYGTVVNDTYTVSYVPRTNAIISEGSYHDIPLYMVNYKDQILFTGIFIGVPSVDHNPRKLYIAYTKDGTHWIEVPIVVDGSYATGIGTQYIHIVPINEKQWLVTVQNNTGVNVAYYTLNSGKSWKLISAAFKGDGLLATYAPTESVIFSDEYRSYDGGITAVPLPDNNSEIAYTATTSSSPSDLGDSHVPAMGCGNNPNKMFTYGYDGVFLFN